MALHKVNRVRAILISKAKVSPDLKQKLIFIFKIKLCKADKKSFIFYNYNFVSVFVNAAFGNIAANH